MYLQLKNISKSYYLKTANEKKAIDNINFTLEKGRLLCLLGPSGCGKSTILKAIGGFVKVDSGNVFLDNNDITNLPPESRDVSTVFQSYGLFSHMNVISNIIYGLKFKGVSKKNRIDMGMQILRQIGLDGYEKKMVSELSGGEQQRVAIARSLIIKPKLLLLDEPLSNLDAKLRISMRKEIKRLQKEFNITTVFVTHDQSEAFEIADKIILMNDGKMMQIDTPENIYNTPKSEFALDFIGESNYLNDSFVRPEKIKVYNIKPKDIITENAIIKKIIFKGDIIELELITSQNIKLKATVLNTGKKYFVGDEIFINYKEEKL